MKTPNRIFATLLLSFAVALVVSPAPAAYNQSAIDELTGTVENPDRKVEELDALYLEVLGDLTPQIASKLEADRGKAVLDLKQLALHASRPDKKDHAKAYCALAAKQLAGAATDATVRQILIEGLGLIGGAESVPVLVALLEKEDAVERGAARMALQRIPTPEAEMALIAALRSASDENLKLGLIDSLGARRATEAILPISALLNDSKPRIAAAAAAAMGRIGGSAAVKALGTARNAATDPIVQRNLENALMDVAQQRRLAGDGPGAAMIYEVVGKQTQHSAIQAAAVIGAAHSSPRTTADVVIAAVQSKDPRVRSAGISAAVKVPSSRLTKGLAKMIPTQPKHVQIQLLEVLAAKGDISVQDDVVALFKKTEDEDLKEATIRALGPLGTITVLELLLTEATSKSRRNRTAALGSLIALKGTDIKNALEFHAREGKTSEIRTVAVGLFMRNRDKTGLKRMIAFAGESDTGVRSAALGVLRKQAGDSQLRDLLVLMNTGKPGVDAVVRAVCGRTEEMSFATNEVISALGEAEKDSVKRDLIGCLQVLGTSRALAEVEKHLKEGSRNSDAAYRALGQWPDPMALPVMVRVLQESKESAITRMMVNGIARLLKDADDLPQKMRLRYAVEAFEASDQKGEQMMLLPVLGKLPSQESADIIHKMLGDRNLKQTAAYAGSHLCQLMIETHPDAALALAKALMAGPYNSKIKGRARAVMLKLQ